MELLDSSLNVDARSISDLNDPDFRYRRQSPPLPYDNLYDDDECCIWCAAVCEPVQQLLCSRFGRATGALLLMLLIYLVIVALTTSPDNFSVLGDSVLVTPRKEANRTRALELKSDLCDAYKRGRVSGDLCNRLCYDREWAVYDFYEENEKVVLILQDAADKYGATYVLKSSSPFYDDFDRSPQNMTNEQFSNLVLDTVNDNLMLEWPQEFKRNLLETIWPTLLRTPGEKMAPVDRASLWSLLQQPEFVLFRLIPISRVTPLVVGTCGHMYQVQTIVPFGMKKHYMSLKSKILSHLMGTLKLLYEFLSEPLEWCDVRFDHLGLAAEYPKRFMLMNGNHVYTAAKLRSMFQNTTCETDEDCVIRDCNSTCTEDGYCSPIRANNNLDVVCEKLVRKLYGTFVSTNNKYLIACNDLKKPYSERLSLAWQAWIWTYEDL